MNADELMNETVTDLKPIVQSIERDAMSLTQGNYGEYLKLLSQPHCKDETMAKFLALALIRAGANQQGVRNALAIAYPETKTSII
jgi:hypothetical protein|tara:strand:- start:3277 stop:3531 length:255 start_codon:yes stop_codon:yes gene_type:complete